jgi:hypothetical protein
MIRTRQLGLPPYPDKHHFHPAWLTPQDANFFAPDAEPAAVASPDTRAEASAAVKISKR